MDLDISFNLTYCIASNITYYSSLIVLTSVAWQVLFVCIPMAYVIIRLQVNNISNLNHTVVMKRYIHFYQILYIFYRFVMCFY